MFATQLSGLFKRLTEKEEQSIEDGARLLAQAALGEGTIYIYGTGEMAAIGLEAVHGAEPLASARVLGLGDGDRVGDFDDAGDVGDAGEFGVPGRVSGAGSVPEQEQFGDISATDRMLKPGPLSDIGVADRVLLAARQSDDPAVLKIAQSLLSQGVPFVAISAQVRDGGLQQQADVHIDLGLAKGLLPDENGERFGYPASMAALFVYHGLKFAIDEMLAEYEE
ncbi:DUF2529 family protein [Mesobacillus zeae]|nr:DUF2529 family protein [Mesobacillus zeae]